MRTYALTIAAAAFFALPTSAFSQNVRVEPGRRPDRAWLPWPICRTVELS